MTPLPLTTTAEHWLDKLTAAIHDHREALQADLDALAVQACPPVDLFVRGSQHVTAGRELVRRYTNIIGRNVRTGTISRHTYRQALQTTTTTLATHGDAALLGAAVTIYAGGLASASADDVLFQLGDGDDDDNIGDGDIALRFVRTLQQAGVIGEPVLNERGNYVWFDDTPAPQAVAVTIVGTWFNWLRATKSAEYAQMSAVPVVAASQTTAQRANMALLRRRIDRCASGQSLADPHSARQPVRLHRQRSGAGAGRCRSTARCLRRGHGRWQCAGGGGQSVECRDKDRGKNPPSISISNLYLPSLSPPPYVGERSLQKPAAMSAKSAVSEALAVRSQRTRCAGWNINSADPSGRFSSTNKIIQYWFFNLCQQSI
jgi:hypothetical protein